MNNSKIKIETFISIVIVRTDQQQLGKYCNQLQSYLDDHFTDYEIVIIDDQKQTLEKADLLARTPSIRWLTLAFPVDTDIAMGAGLENAIGDFVIFIRPDIDPVDVILSFHNLAAQGNDVVIGLANSPKTIPYKLFRSIFSRVLTSIGYNIPKNSTPTRCLSRQAINTILQTGSPAHQFFLRTTKTGYPSVYLNYHLLASPGKQTLFDGIKTIFKFIVFNSIKPLRWMSVLGALGSVSAFLFAVYSIIVNLVKNTVIEGWTSMVLFSSVQFMILFIILAFLGEYIARLLQESNNSRSYYVSHESNSAIKLEAERLNIQTSNFSENS